MVTMLDKAIELMRVTDKSLLKAKKVWFMTRDGFMRTGTVTRERKNLPNSKRYVYFITELDGDKTYKVDEYQIVNIQY